MYEKLEACPLCEEQQFKNHVIAKDHLVSQESFAIVECVSCGFIFTNPRPTKNDISRYYQSENYISHKNKANSPINLAYKIARHFTIKSKVQLAQKFKPKTILDFGCGTGTFLEACSRQSISAYGVEPDTDARNQIEKSITVVPSLEELPDGIKFNVVTLWHVLEHVHDLKQTLAEIRKKLHKDGILIVAVPNVESYDAKHYKEHWAAYDVPRHLYHFTKDTMQQLMSSMQMKKVDLLPQKLDAFYVSLLSEKYQNKSNQIFRAINFGIKSNKKAKSNKMYSSLIYIYSK